MQTPFTTAGDVDHDDLERLVDHAITAGADGLLTTAVASETAMLSESDRAAVISSINNAAAGRVPIVVGASAESVEDCRRYAATADGLDGYLVAVPQHLYGQPKAIVDFFVKVAAGRDSPLLLQDLRWNGPGLPVEVVEQLVDHVPGLAGIKVETVPAGPAYTALLEHFSGRLFVCAGWAVAQLVEALDRGVHAIVPESSMLPSYRAILDLYIAGHREEAQALFRRLLPVLAYTNQELVTSIAFFKRLLVRKGIISSQSMRLTGFEWDKYNSRISEDLISLYLDLEREIRRTP